MYVGVCVCRCTCVCVCVCVCKYVCVCVFHFNRYFLQWICKRKKDQWTYYLLHTTYAKYTHRHTLSAITHVHKHNFSPVTYQTVKYSLIRRINLHKHT